MGVNGELPAHDPPVVPNGVVLHADERTRVTRLFLPGGSVVRKEPLGRLRDARLRQEKAVLERLSGVAGVVQLVASRAYPESLLLADVGGTALASSPTPMKGEELLRLAVKLARVVAGVHRQGVVHMDINPANILLAGEGREPYLIDFSLATTFAELRPEFTHYTKIVGTLPYLSPERTGRIGRPVDQRADLYALGATLYELATGDPPFGTGDPLRLGHDLLARVPAPPDRVNPAAPHGLSEIIMHLLEKEPDNRYQTAEGLLHDLVQVRNGASVRVGEYDFPTRLLPPSRLVGRDGEIASLEAAFTAAAAGQCRGVLVSGAPGVGKTALINELRPIVTAADGWFVAGKFDQYRRDQEFDAVSQAFRALGRLLLAEPEEDLAELRERILTALGSNAGLIAALVPEFSTLLQLAPDPGDLLTAQARAQRNAVEILRAVASRKRPVVVVVDDLQWAARTPLGFIDMVLSEGEQVDGLLLVGAYRPQEVDATHPLAAMLSRWGRQSDAPEHVRLENLPVPSLAALVADMLRLDAESAAELAWVIAPHTGGNPYDTVELLNSLRHEGILTHGVEGWQWDRALLRRRLDRTDVARLLAKRADSMPATTRALLDAMACLGGQVELSVLQAAIGQPVAVVERRLAPALDDGLLVLEPGSQEVVRFRHDRVREIILGRLKPERRRALQLDLGRRLATRPDLFAVAADQYLPVVDAVQDPKERRRVVALLRRAAGQASILSNHPVVYGCLTAAAQLVDPADTATLIGVHTGRHAALCSLGRLEEADEIYDTIERLGVDPLQWADATAVQVNSLTNRNRPREAIELGFDLLRQLGVAVPAPERLDAEIEDRLDALYRWVQETSAADDLRRPDITDPVLLAAGRLMERMMPTAYFCDHEVMAWLTGEAARIWAEHGPGRTLLGPIGHIAFVTAGRRQDYRTGYRVMRRILKVAEERGYEPEVFQIHFLYAASTGSWFEPVEDSVSLAFRAREGSIRSGDLQTACYTYYTASHQFIEYAPTLGDYAAELEAGLAFAGRIGNDQTAQTLTAYRHMVRLLRGEGDAPADDHRMATATYGDDRLAAAHAQVAWALVAALLGDQAQFLRRTTAMMPALPAMVALFPLAEGYLLRALALAGEARIAAAGERGAILAELDATIDWLAARAADAPVNFLHLLRLVEAERAWTAGDFQTAAHAFDAAQREASQRQRPWQRALILERAAKFYLAHGMERVGGWLLGEARREYLDWGATAKVYQLDWAYPTLQNPPRAPAEPEVGQPDGHTTRESTVTPGTIDLLGTFAAAQALSSEKSIEGLRAKVGTALSAMTGATHVHLLLWNGDQPGWILVTPGAGRTIPLDEAGQKRMLPLSVVRYAQRTTQPLMIDDAKRDDRFARDPYLADLGCCSLLAVPIFNRGMLRALLLLENHLIHGAFSTERLDGVMLIAGQLAVSLDNALVYASLERKVEERTQQLAAANERLAQLSVTDFLTGLANRRRLDEVLDVEWNRARHSGTPLGLALADLDHFKLYNDRYGHPAGDDCLQRIAEVFKRNIRDTDLVARYGGEEFAVVMPDTDIDAACSIGARLRTAVAALCQPHALSPARIVTVSIGVAAMVPPEMGTAQRLIELADVELYRAKRSGRNRIRAA